MKRVFYSLLFSSFVMYASQPVHITVKQKQDIIAGAELYALQCKKAETQSASLKILGQAIGLIDQRKKEYVGFVDVKKIEIAENGFQLTELQKRLKYQNDAWLAENNKKFESQIPIAKAQAALARYQRLSPQMQWQEAQYCVIPGVCTPEGIMHYWQAKVNGNLAEEQYFFNQQKQQRLNQIASDRLPIVVTQIPASLEYKKMLDEQYQDLQSNAAAYDDLHQNFSNLRNNQAAVKVTDFIRRVAAKNKLKILRQEHASAQKITTAVREFSAKSKLHRLQEEGRVKAELLEKEKQKNAAITIESMYRGILARRKIPALRQQRDERSQMMAEENKTRIVMQQERELLAKMVYEQEQADKLAKEKEAKYRKNLKKREHDKKKKLMAREQEQKEQEELVQKSAEYETASEELLKHASIDRQAVFKEFQQRGLSYEKLVELMNQYDKNHNTFSDEYSGAQQLVYQLDNLLIDYNLDQVQYLSINAQKIDDRLQEQGLSLSVYFENQNHIHAQIVARLAALNNELQGFTDYSVKNRWIELKEYHKRLSLKLLSLIDQVKIDTLEITMRLGLLASDSKYKNRKEEDVLTELLEKEERENKKLIDLKTSLEQTKTLIQQVEQKIHEQDSQVNKCIAREQLTKIQKIIASKPKIADVAVARKESSPPLGTVGFLTPQDLERRYQKADNFIKNILQIKRTIAPDDLIPLLTKFMENIELSSEDKQNFIIQMSNSVVDGAAILDRAHLTEEFKQNIFEHVLNGAQEADQISILADIAKLQTMLIDVLVKYKEIAKKF